MSLLYPATRQCLAGSKKAHALFAVIRRFQDLKLEESSSFSRECFEPNHIWGNPSEPRLAASRLSVICLQGVTLRPLMHHSTARLEEVI